MTQYQSQSTASCLVCESVELRPVDGFRALPRITSDCRAFPPGGDLFVCDACGAVQKQPTDEWLREIGEIYSAYASYYQSGGDEQIVFDKATGQPRRRSDVIVDRLVASRSFPETGSVLDVGCGNGVTLSSIGTAFPKWTLYGYELGNSTLERLQRIPRFEKLYTESLSTVSRSFDLVTMIHSLEHFPSPGQAADSVREVVGSGRLFVEVCNIDQNPFDILVADHIMHFSPSTLTNLLNRAGFEVVSVATEWVPKEISLLARRGNARSTNPTSPEFSGSTVHKRTSTYVNWLHDMTLVAQELAKGKRPFGLFGTSIAATWLGAQLGKSVAFYVDEDESRVGKTHFGQPIVRPSDVPRDSVVYLALAPTVAEIVAKKLSVLGLAFALPPKLN